MASTYTQIYMQCVFAVKGRQNLLDKAWREEVFKYMAGVIKAKNQKPFIINGVSDHVHIFVGLKPTMNVSDLMRDVKNNSSKFINEQKYLEKKFSWQEGFGAFSYAHSQIDRVYNYIAKQEEHHKEKTFKDEYIKLLKEFEVDYKEEYLFDWLDSSD